MPAKPSQRLLYSKRDAAEQLSISLRSLNYLVSRGEIRFRRIGSRVLVPRGELVQFARAHHPEPIIPVGNSDLPLATQTEGHCE